MMFMSAAPNDERKLIKKAQKGDAEAFEALVNRYYDTLYRFAYKWSGVQADAEDIAQQSCIKLARALPQYRFEAAFSTWLYRLVVSCAQDWWRREQRHYGVPAEEPEQGTEPTTEPSPQGETEVFLFQLMRRLDAMADGFKETALLVLAEGCSHREAAYILGIKESTVSWRLHTIRKQLSQLQTGEDSQ